MKHLLSLGHRRIGAITGPRGLEGDRGPAPGLLRRRSRQRGSRPIPSSRSRRTSSRAAARTAAAQLLELDDPPTAIFAFNDNMAIGAMQAARARGVRVRRSSRSSASTTSRKRRSSRRALTTVRQPLAEMGRIAVSLLLRLLDNQPLEALHVELATRLIVRESTAPPPPGA